MSLICNAPWSGLFVWNDGTVSYCGRTKAVGRSPATGFPHLLEFARGRQHADTVSLDKNSFGAGCPPTCCYLTIKNPSEYMRYFDGNPPDRPAAPPMAMSAPLPRITQDLAENEALIEDDVKQLQVGCLELS